MIIIEKNKYTEDRNADKNMFFGRDDVVQRESARVPFNRTILLQFFSDEHIVPPISLQNRSLGFVTADSTNTYYYINICIVKYIMRLIIMRYYI